MSLGINVSQISLKDFLALNTEELNGNYRTQSVEIIYSDIEALNWRLILMIAPISCSWGMLYQCENKIAAWQEENLQQTNIPKILEDTLKALGVNPSYVPKGLFKYSTFGHEDEIVLGETVPELSRATFRAEIYPLSSFDSLNFVTRLNKHLVQLGEYFMLNNANSVESSKSLMSPRLEGLFYDCPSEPADSVQHYDECISRLNNALDNVGAEESNLWLTSKFLENEKVISNYPISKSLSLGSIIFGSLVANLAVAKQRHSKQRMLAILRIKLLQKWKWPMGARKLNRLKADREYRDFILENRPPCHELENEVSKYLEMIKEDYTVLFD